MEIVLYHKFNKHYQMSKSVLNTKISTLKMDFINNRLFDSYIYEYDNDYSKDLADFVPQRLREKGIL